VTEAGFREFLEVFATLEGESSWLRVLEARQEEDALHLRLELNPEWAGAVQEWGLACGEVEFLCLGMRAGGPAVHYTDHPYLWPYIQPELELYIHGSPEAPDRILRRMFQAYEEAVGMNPWNCEQWPPVPAGIRNIRRSEQFFADGYGLLAKGPERLVQSYVRVLEDEGLDHQVLNRGMGWRLEKRRHLPAPELLDLQPDFVIARRFRAARLA